MIRFPRLAIERGKWGARGDRAQPEGGLIGFEFGRCFDPEGGNSPEGEWRPEDRLVGRGSEQATGRSEETAGSGANRIRQWSRRPNELVSDCAGSEVAGQER